MGWISVKDRLPKKHTWVLTYPNPYGSDNEFNYPRWTLAYLNVNSVWVSSAHSRRWKDPTHWMPLPDPPNDSATYPPKKGVGGGIMKRILRFIQREIELCKTEKAKAHTVAQEMYWIGREDGLVIIYNAGIKLDPPNDSATYRQTIGNAHKEVE